jgi:hypothetical protein
MNCEEFKDAIVVRIYGELPPDREAALQRHVGECDDCARVYARTLGLQNVNDVDDDIPTPDWEASWRVIRERTQKKRWRLPALFEWPAKRFAMAAAAVVIVFVFGVLAGRSIFFPPAEPEWTTPGRGIQSVTSVATYTETLEPLLIDFMNRSGQTRSDEMSELTDRVAIEMLAQTRLLKRAAERSSDAELYFLLEDIELVLISIANLGGQNGDVAEQLDQIIKNKAIMFRLRQLPAGQSTI